MENILNQYLSKKDYAELLSIGHKSLYTKDASSLTEVVNDLTQIVGYNNCACAFGNLAEALNQQNPSINCINVSYPEEYLYQYLDNELFKTDEVIKEFSKSFSPVNWRKVDERHGTRYPAAELAMDFNMVDGWTYGTLDPNSLECSLFFFGGEDSESTLRSKAIIEYAVPFLSEAYKRVLNLPNAKATKLTPKEFEVLKWLKEGKSSWEISTILHCSKRVIDFHARNIIDKLGATNRTDAVVKALHHGVISF